MSERLPSLKPREVIRALERAGFSVRRTSGSHYLLQHCDSPSLQVVVPYHATDIKRGLLHGIIKQAGLTPADFLKLLR